MQYTPPLDDIRFNLEAFGYEAHIASLEKFEDFDLETSFAMLDEYARYCAAKRSLSGRTTADRFNADDLSVTAPGMKPYDGFADELHQPVLPGEVRGSGRTAHPDLCGL